MLEELDEKLLDIVLEALQGLELITHVIADLGLGRVDDLRLRLLSDATVDRAVVV